VIYGDSRNLLLNLKLLVDSVFLRDGHFTNVSKGDLVGSTDVSSLIEDDESASWFMGVSGAQVWQSPYQEWVYESGITMNDAPFISGLVPPSRASGVYVNGTFFAENGGISGVDFKIDYIYGRVILTNGTIPSNSQVQAEYSYRHFRAEIANKYAEQDITYFTSHELKDNPWSNNNTSYPTGAQRIGPIPVIFIQLGDGSSEAYELGNKSQIKNRDVFFHIYTENDIERDSAMDLLDTRWSNFMPMIDFNYAPLPISGLTNTLSPVYIPYQTLLENVSYNGNKVISKHFEFKEMMDRPLNPLVKLERGIVEGKMNIYNIAPTGRIEPNPFI